MPDSTSIFPWVEANQGLLSVLALVVALAVAVIEHLRVLRQAELDLARDVDIAVDVVNRVYLTALAAGPDTEAGHIPFGEVEQHAIRARRMLEAMTTARPHSAKYALALQIAIERMQEASVQAVGLWSNPTRAKLRVREELDAARAAIVEARELRKHEANSEPLRKQRGKA